MTSPHDIGDPSIAELPALLNRLFRDNKLVLIRRYQSEEIIGWDAGEEEWVYHQDFSKVIPEHIAWVNGQIQIVFSLEENQ